METSLLILCAAFAFSFLLRCEAVEFYVSPTEPDQSTNCYYQHSQWVQQTRQYFYDFLNGVHNLLNQSLEIENVTNLTISILPSNDSVVQSSQQQNQISWNPKAVNGECWNHNCEPAVYNTYINQSDIQNIILERSHWEVYRDDTSHEWPTRSKQYQLYYISSLIPSNNPSSFLSKATTVSIIRSLFTSSNLKVTTVESSQTWIFISQSQFLNSSNTGI